MGNCCATKSKSRKNSAPLMEGVYNPSQRSASNPTASPLRASQDRSSSRERNSESNTRASYTPPVSNGAGAKIAIRKLSLSTCPAQVKNAKLVFPSPKFGEIKKLGHVVKNWKTRFFVLEGARLQYYALGKHNPDSSKFKGEMDLEGGSVTEVNEAKRLTILVHDTQMVLEFENLNVMTEWKFALKECIRIANCNSLIKGQRIPDVVSWYNEQYTLYLNAASVLRKGGMFCLHYVDARDGYVELIPIWLQENPGGTGFMMMCDHVTVQSTGPPMVGGADPSVTPTATRTRIQGLDIPYNTITSIMTGSKTEVYHTPEMGGTSSTFFSFGTVSETLVLEVKSRAVRDHWATCIRDVINFIHIPMPGERIETQQAPKKTVVSRRNSRHSESGWESD